MDNGDVTARIGAEVRSRRLARRLSLSGLASASGVSRSMISLVERGEASPTAVVLDRLATALGVPLAALFGGGAEESPLVRRADQVEWRDPESGYRRRALSPPGRPSPLRLVEVEFPPGARVAYETGTREGEVEQQVWVLDGEIDIAVGEHSHRLGPGDCLGMRLDRPIVFANPGSRAARYLVALAEAAA